MTLAVARVAKVSAIQQSLPSECFEISGKDKCQIAEIRNRRQAGVTQVRELIGASVVHEEPELHASPVGGIVKFPAG